jgi:hypothetical protein
MLVQNKKKRKQSLALNLAHKFKKLSFDVEKARK